MMLPKKSIKILLGQGNRVATIKPAKGRKPGKLGKLEKLSKRIENSKKFVFCAKTCNTQGNCKICCVIANENVLQTIFLS